jgi:hypothetical protein
LLSHRKSLAKSALDQKIHFIRPASQLSTMVIGGAVAASTSTFTRKRPLGAM